MVGCFRRSVPQAIPHNNKSVAVARNKNKNSYKLEEQNRFNGKLSEKESKEYKPRPTWYKDTKYPAQLLKHWNNKCNGSNYSSTSTDKTEFVSESNNSSFRVGFPFSYFLRKKTPLTDNKSKIPVNSKKSTKTKQKTLSAIIEVNEPRSSRRVHFVDDEPVERSGIKRFFHRIFELLDN